MICPNCKEEMSEKEDIFYDYTTIKYWHCYECGNEVWPEG